MLLASIAWGLMAPIGKGHHEHRGDSLVVAATFRNSVHPPADYAGYHAHRLESALRGKGRQPGTFYVAAGFPILVT